MNRAALRDNLLAIEAELQALGLWDTTQPDASAFESELPFFHDTMTLTQWIQWLLLPRLNAILDAEAVLPETCSIAPIAEEGFKQIDASTDALYSLIIELDELVTAL